MKGETAVVQKLNTCLRDQLTAINQLFLHARIAKNWGLNQLNDYEYGRSIAAMKMADDLIERILFLDGLPNLQDLGKLMIGEDVPEMLQCDMNLLTALRGNLLDTIATCEQTQDFVSRDELNELLEATEAHIDWVETQQWQIQNIGLENYLQSQMGAES